MIVSPRVLTFTAENWATGLAVTVTAVSDFMAEDFTHSGAILH